MNKPSLFFQIAGILLIIEAAMTFINNFTSIHIWIPYYSVWANITGCVLICIAGAVVKKPLIIIGSIMFYGLTITWAIGGRPASILLFGLTLILPTMGAIALAVDALKGKMRKKEFVIIIATILFAIYAAIYLLLVFIPFIGNYLWDIPFFILVVNYVGLIFVGIFFIIRESAREETLAIIKPLSAIIE